MDVYISLLTLLSALSTGHVDYIYSIYIKKRVLIVLNDDLPIYKRRLLSASQVPFPCITNCVLLLEEDRTPSPWLVVESSASKV